MIALKEQVLPLHLQQLAPWPPEQNGHGSSILPFKRDNSQNRNSPPRLSQEQVQSLLLLDLQQEQHLDEMSS